MVVCFDVSKMQKFPTICTSLEHFDVMISVQDFL